MMLGRFRIGRRGRALAFGLGAIVALACPACASKGKAARDPMGSMTLPPMATVNDPSRRQASSPMTDPWATCASLPMASAGSPTFAR